MIQHAQGPEGVPAAGAACFLHVEMGLAGVFGLHRPGAVFAPLSQQDIQGVLHARVVADASRLKVSQRAQNVVKPAAWIGEHQEAPVNDLARVIGAKEPVLQQKLAGLLCYLL